MGPTPKPSKRRKQATSTLPLLRDDVPQHLPVGRTPQQPAAPSRQSAIPQGTAYETAVTIPGLHHTLELLAGLDPDGYFKATTGDEGKSWFLAWRWQRGQWAGHYVMARVNRGECAWGMQLLAEKVAAVRAGHRRPTRDRYGD